MSVWAGRADVGSNSAILDRWWSPQAAAGHGVRLTHEYFVGSWLQEPYFRYWVRFLMKTNILGFNGVVHSVKDDVSVDSEASVVTSPISRICRLSL